MNLKEIREKFRDLTGRRDLVDDTGHDHGADFFINAAQRWLDRKLDFGGGEAEISVSLSTGDKELDLGAHTSSVSGLRAIKEVGVEDADGDFVWLDRRDYTSLRDFSLNSESSDQDTPRYYGVGRFSPSNRTSVERKLLLHPPAEGGETLRVRGLFSSIELKEDTDVSWWSQNFPLILVKAAAFRMEALQRNTTGESDYRQSLMEDLQGIDHDEVEQDETDRDQMKNLWRRIR